TLTPRRTAASSSRSTSPRSKRKMQTSISLRARRIAWTTGITPASGCTINFASLRLTLATLRRFRLRLFVPRDLRLGVRRERRQRAGHAVGADLPRRGHEILHFLLPGGTELETGVEAPQHRLDARTELLGFLAELDRQLEDARLRFEAFDDPE